MSYRQDLPYNNGKGSTEYFHQAQGNSAYQQRDIKSELLPAINQRMSQTNSQIAYPPTNSHSNYGSNGLMRSSDLTRQNQYRGSRVQNNTNSKTITRSSIPYHTTSNHSNIPQGLYSLQENEFQHSNSSARSDASLNNWVPLTLKSIPRKKQKNSSLRSVFALKQVKSDFEKEQNLENTAYLTINCSICSEPMSQKAILTLPLCGHTLHAQCLASYTPFLKVLCPFQKCDKSIKQAFLRHHLPNDILQRFWAYEANTNTMMLIRQKKLIYCPEQNCNEIFLHYLSGLAKQKAFYTCTKTKRQFCSKCNLPWHRRIPDCEAYKKRMDPQSEQYKYLKLAQQKNWMQCAKCLQFVQKNEGCVHIRCVCGYDFCYICGGPFPVCDCSRAQYQGIEWQNDLLKTPK